MNRGNFLIGKNMILMENPKYHVCHKPDLRKKHFFVMRRGINVSDSNILNIILIEFYAICLQSFLIIHLLTSWHFSCLEYKVANTFGSVNYGLHGDSLTNWEVIWRWTKVRASLCKFSLGQWNVNGTSGTEKNWTIFLTIQNLKS